MTPAEPQDRRRDPTGKGERSTGLGSERGLGAGLDARGKVDVPVDVPQGMDESRGQRSECLWDEYGTPQLVVLVTTADSAGNVNCAPEHRCTAAGSHGFLFVCGTDHDTFMNVQSTGEFVVNVPGAQRVDRLHALAREGTASWENELERARGWTRSSSGSSWPRARTRRRFARARAQSA